MNQRRRLRPKIEVARLHARHAPQDDLDHRIHPIERDQGILPAIQHTGIHVEDAIDEGGHVEVITSRLEIVDVVLPDIDSKHERVRSCAAIEAIAAYAAVHPRTICAGPDGVDAVIAEQKRVSASAFDGVVARTTMDQVTALACSDAIGALGARDGHGGANRAL